MTNFQYMDYAEVNRRLDNLVNNKDVKIKVKKEEPLGMTDFLLPINHYTIGNGPKHIVVTGSYHAAEIITTIFVVRLMEDLALNPGEFNPEEYTIDFIPIVNPEGYLITTSMQNLYLEQGKTEEEKIALAKDYWRIYREDAAKTIKANKENDIETLRAKKGYQALFDNVDLTKFLNEYPALKESVMAIIEKNNYPIGVCGAWTANGHGIDLSQNAPFNSSINKFKQSKEPFYSGTAYSNIRKDIPGPINCPCRDLNNFEFESENVHILNFLANLNATKDQEIVAFLNYHSVMGKMYQRPVLEESMYKMYDIDYSTKLIENYVGARIMKEENAYDIIEGEDPYNYINEYFRIRYGINIQPELSRMGSNPIGPLADPQTFENVTVKPNIEAFKKFVQNLEFIKHYAKHINILVNVINEKRENQGLERIDAKELYEIIDKVCRDNPTLYTKLREETSMLEHYNFQVISYLFDKIDKYINGEISFSETTSIKDELINENGKSVFDKNFAEFINGLVGRLNSKREKSNLPLLGSDYACQLVDNISRDYPEAFAKLKRELNSENVNQDEIENLYSELIEVVGNQISMNNLIDMNLKNYSPDLLKIVNKDNKLSKNYVPDRLINVENPYYQPLNNTEKLMVPDYVATAFNEMKSDALKIGHEIFIACGYCSYEYQQSVIDYYADKMETKVYNFIPGASEYQLGLAIDIGAVVNGAYYNVLNDGIDVTKWIFDNAHNYGFILRYSKDNEHWHLRFVGKDLAKYLTQNNITLEEYLTPEISAERRLK